MKTKDFASAIRYLLISGRGEESFLAAQQYQQMDIFTKVIGSISEKFSINNPFLEFLC